MKWQLKRSRIPLGRAALAYADLLGWPVFPLAPRTKIPAIPKHAGGSGCLDATTNPVRIAQWWQEDPERNIALATGPASGFFVVDVDPRNGGDAALDELEATYGLLPETVEGSTGGGGRHLLYRMVSALADVMWSQLVPGVDLKGTGGYIVAPPSIHPSGNVYAWEHSRHPLETPIADPPAWLVASLTESTTRYQTPRPPDYWRALVCDGIDEGGRNHAVAQLAGHLLRRGVDPYVTLALTRSWNLTQCRPPLPDAEVACTVDSIAVREVARRRVA